MSIIRWRAWKGKVMAKRDPNQTARNKRDKEITTELNALWPTVSADTKINDQQSFIALIGGKAATFINLKNAGKPKGQDFVITRRSAPTVERHISVTEG